MFEECVIRGKRFCPARFSAPLAGYTHSAFRRLVAELGGCGAVWTEMLATRQILGESFRVSPWLRRRPDETNLVYQLMVGAEDPLEKALAKLAEHGVEMVDLNLACNAWSVRRWQSGSALFENLDALRMVIDRARRHWPGILTAKIRLGRQVPGWEAAFAARVRVLEEAGLDALTLHPRFFEDRLKRRVRYEVIPWAASLTKLPLIANGDISGPDHVEALEDRLQGAQAVMVGRMAIVCPWIFADWNISGDPNRAAIWRKMHGYLSEDFPPAIALRRLQMFTKYYSANYLFSHQFHVAVSNTGSMDHALERAEEFFSRDPAVCLNPTVPGC